jgi:hypothetical protein
MRQFILVIFLFAAAAVLSLFPLERGIPYLIVRSIGFGFLCGAFVTCANFWGKARQKVNADSDLGDLPGSKGQP